MCGAVSEDNEVYNASDGRYEPKDTEYTSIEKINEAVISWLKDSFFGKTAEEKFSKGETNLSEWNSVELWSLSKYAKHLSEAYDYKDRPFDLMKGDTFYNYQYDECGLTNMVWTSDETDKTWVVFVDMHS